MVTYAYTYVHIFVNVESRVWGLIPESRLLKLRSVGAESRSPKSRFIDSVESGVQQKVPLGHHTFLQLADPQIAER